MNKNVIIIGAGGHAKSIADIIIKSGDNLIGFLDDNISIDTEIIHTTKTKVIGKTEDIYKYNDSEFVIGIGSNVIREVIADKYKVNYYTAIHPNSNIALDVQIGKGSVVMSNACINTNAKIGEHCIINTGAIVEHDNNLADFVHICPNVTLAGTVSVGKYTQIGVGATIRNNINISENVLVGAGAVVVKDICEEGIYIGVPAKKRG